MSDTELLDRLQAETTKEGYSGVIMIEVKDVRNSIGTWLREKEDDNGKF